MAVARRRVRELLGEGHPASDDVILLVSEVVTNSVVHSCSGGGGRVAMTVAVEPDAVFVEVSDAGSGASAPHVRIDPEAESGRGMFLVDLIARRWGVLDDSRGSRTLWFEVAF
ncbi:anti-sigma regulatory factor (Ser/Thr protein kinase) [Streptosporangium becharense]|uniref:Anti-sigma regulatory factor (Ser/Thr protein kinase) n=1 Tax=Streptosporangium becharense TaxID=1816182 RepID=A0A7W9MJ08_9ACTN|nr:ATP-binding protein [Streptosporangium becharense]MBB2911602.1 anti-sigma regulatory factor (Ser/Thr protein kinase) [Streptosporangium becharense]MBB5822580.1 anti-sigma regulatory factor (Ser/Thr protein kinase) [Streptosporangium becharense]